MLKKLLITTAVSALLVASALAQATAPAEQSGSTCADINFTGADSRRQQHHHGRMRSYPSQGRISGWRRNSTARTSSARITRRSATSMTCCSTRRQDLSLRRRRRRLPRHRREGVALPPSAFQVDPGEAAPADSAALRGATAGSGSSTDSNADQGTAR